jgi:hypothetical protein
MAGPRKGTGLVLLVLGGILLALIAVWDLTNPDSLLRGLFDPTQNRGSSVRSIMDGVRRR